MWAKLTKEDKALTFEENFHILKQKYTFINFDKSINSQFDSLSQVKFLIDVEKIFALKINLILLDKDNLGVYSALRAILNNPLQK